MDQRDWTIFLSGLGVGVVLILGSLYYIGGKSALLPITGLGDRLIERSGLKLKRSRGTDLAGSELSSSSGSGVDDNLQASAFDPPSSASSASSPSSVRPATPQSSPAESKGNGASGLSMRVRINNLTIHKCAGYECASIATLPLGASVTLLGDCDTSTGEEWCRVRAAKIEGWVSRYYLE